jgi:hypothetical protein
VEPVNAVDGGCHGLTGGGIHLLRCRGPFLRADRKPIETHAIETLRQAREGSIPLGSDLLQNVANFLAKLGRTASDRSIQRLRLLVSR